MDDNDTGGTDQPEAKHWTSSKTVWINVAIAFLESLELSSGAMTAVVGPQAAAVLVVLVPAINVALRAITTQPITTRKPA